MIARIWRATATPEGAEAYREHFTDSVLPALRRLDGHQGAYLMRRDTDGRVELEVMTLWLSLDDIRSFAGPDLTTAVVEPEARAALLDFDKTVSHQTVVVDTLTGLGQPQ
jgi:heme-degrading monooxygenase HmoA